MVGFAEFAEYDGLGLGSLVQRGEVTPVELLDASLEIIEKLNPKINAIVTSLWEYALRDIERGLPSGPFSGVPMVLKDEYLFYDGVPCDFSSRLGQGVSMDYESTLVQRYRAAGIVISGKANLPEFGASVTTEPVAKSVCRNPWNLERTVGGSSGGSAAAVASGMVPIAYANDGAGSIRIPASCCGCFGLKPTRGRTPTGPVDGEYWNGLVIQHAITRTVRDSAALLDASEGWEPGSMYPAPPKARPFLEEIGAPPGRLRIAFSAESPAGGRVDQACRAAVQSAAALCASLGHDVCEASPAFDGTRLAERIADLLAIHLAYGADELSRLTGREADGAMIERAHYQLIQHGRRLSAQDMLGILEHFGNVARQVAPFFETYDLWLTPTLAEPPVAHGYITSDDPDWQRYISRYFSFVPFTPIANVTGNPAMSIPLYENADRLPIGIHFVGRFGDEATLFRLAGQLEEALPWRNRKPPVSAWTL